MNTNNYFYSCSQTLLSEILNFQKNGENDQTLLENRKLHLDPSWVLISTSLLLSENLLKNENMYKLLNEKQFVMLENILDKTMLDNDYQNLDSYFLDSNNHIINPMHNLVADEFDLEKYLEPVVLKKYKNYGCNQSIITNGVIDYQKLVLRIRNSLAHSNYEIIDDNYLRLYHYNENNELDFNVKINIIIILTVIDELNELADKLYKPFLREYYSRNDEMQFTTHELLDEDIIQNILKYKILSTEEIKVILKIAKKEKDFYPNYDKDNNFDKFSVIYELIFKQIKPICDYGIILNEIIYSMFKNNKNLDNYFYEKYGYYKYFNSDLYESSNFRDKKTIQENKFKIMLLAFLNSILLYGYNSNQNIDFAKIEFNQMQIDEEIKLKYISNKYQKIRKGFQELSNQEKKLQNVSTSLSKLNDQYLQGNNKTDFLKIELPKRIKNLENIYKNTYEEYTKLKKKTQEDMYDKLFEISDLQDNEKLNGEISEFIITHLRNSLAHGYISFPRGINFNDIQNTIICFEDYEKNNREILTFRGSIKIGKLLELLSTKETIEELLMFKNKSK